MWSTDTPKYYTNCLVLIKGTKQFDSIETVRLATYVPRLKDLGNNPWIIRYHSKDNFKDVEIIKWLDLNQLGVKL